MSVVNIRMKNGKRPYYDIYIGRKTRNTEFIKDSKWHNPRLTLEEYELYIRNAIEETPEYFNLDELKGKILGCWCKPKKCHGDVLLHMIESEVV